MASVPFDDLTPNISAPAAPRPKAPRKRVGEGHLRTIVKSLTWRAGGLAMTFGIAWAVTRRLDVAASIGAADTVVKVFAYYAHERLWLRIPFGQSNEPDYEI